MVEVYIPEQGYDPNIGRNYFDVNKVGTLDVLGATLDETFYYNPLNAADRFFEQKLGEGQRGRIMTPDEYADSPYFREGIDVGPEGIKEGLAKLLAERQDKRDAFNLTLSRSKGGYTLGAMQFGTALAGSLLDPLSVASAFVPVVSTARAATFAARYGKNGGRFVAGAVDGVAGAALLEPIVAGQAVLEQDRDYGLMDSFLNVTFGGVMGGGLHVGFGKISDRINASRQDVKDTALTTAVAQAAEGQEISAGNLHTTTVNLAADDVIRRARAVKEYDPTTRAVERTFDEEGNIKTETVIDDPAPGIEEVPQYPTKGQARPKILRTPKPASLIKFIRDEGGISTTDANISVVKRIFGSKYKSIARKDGKKLDEILSRAREEGYIEEALEGRADDIGVGDFLNVMQEDLHSQSVYSRFDVNEVAEYDKAVELAALAEDYGISPAGMDDETFLRALAEAVDRQEVVNFNTASRQGDLSEQEYYDRRDEARSVDYNLGDMIDHRDALEEMDQAGQSLEDMALNELETENELIMRDLENSPDGIPAMFRREIEAAEDLKAKSENFEEVTRVAAECMNKNYKRGADAAPEVAEEVAEEAIDVASALARLLKE